MPKELGQPHAGLATIQLLDAVLAEHDLPDMLQVLPKLRKHAYYKTAVSQHAQGASDRAVRMLFLRACREAKLID